MATNEFDARITEDLVPALAADELLVAQANAAPPSTTGDAPATAVIEVGEGLVLTLPAGASIENPRVNGTDLEFVQPDGTVIVVPNGAITGLTIVVDGTTIPAETVAALFEASGIETAAGPEGPTAPPSSGGNFANPVPGIGEGLPLIDLLPPTDFGLPTPDLEDLPAGLALRSAAFNGPPSFVDPKNGLAIDSFLLNAVSEEEENGNGGVAPGFAGFPSSSNPDTAGSDDTTNARVSSGIITVVDPEDDALTFTLDEPPEALTSQGQTVFWTGQGTNQLIGHVGAIDGPVVITISVVDGTVSSGGGAYTVVLSGPIDHPNDSRTDPADPDEDDFSLNIPVTVSDGLNTDSATLVLPIEDDSPEMLARKAETTTETTTETIFYSLQAGNTDMRGMDGSGGRDILLTGLDVNEGDNSVNTSGSSIGVGDGQSVDGYELSGPKANPNISGPELLTLEFLRNLVITPNPPGAPTVTHAGSYDVASVKFTVDVAEAHSIEDAVVFVGSNDGSQFQSSIKVNGVVVGSATPVFEGGIQVGYVFVVPDNATVEVVGATPFDALRIGNYNDFAFDSDGNSAADTTLSGGNAFKVLGVEASVTIVTTTTEVLAVSHDETIGANPGADPNASNDTGDTPPVLLAGATGYAKSSINALSLFSYSIGADGGASYAFAVTDAAGATLDNAPSGLFTLDGSAILLSTDSDGVLVGSAGGNTVFKVLVDTDGTVWIAQYLPIAHDLDGGTAAAYDDVAVVLAALHVKATISDFDKDPAEAISDVALRVEFQDDGPDGVDDSNTISEDALSVTGHVVTGAGADTFGLDGAAATGPVIALESGPAGTSDTNPAGGFVVAGLYGTLTLDASGAYTYTLYTALQNPATYALVQSLGPAESLGNEVFTYTIADGDGDTDTATLTITIIGSDDGVTITGIGAEAGDHTVYEDDLADGSSTDIPALTRTGTFNISAPDGVDDLTVGGVAIVTNGVVTGNVGVAFDTDYGRLTITSVNLGTGEIAYSYWLDDNTLAHGPGDDAKNAVFDTIAVVLTDTDTSSAATSLLIKVTDDIPDAVDDTVSQSPENAPVTVNVLGNDEQGADGVAVSAVTYVADTLTGPGTLTNNGDGSFTYTPLPGETGVVTFDYQIADGDGDRSVATVTITLAADSTPTVTVTDGTVDEKGLADGSGELDDPAPGTDNSETTTGTFSTTTGGDTLAKLEVQGSAGFIDVTAATLAVPVTVTGANGILTVTSDGAGVYSWSYTLSNNLLTHDDTIVDGDSDRGADDQKTGDTFNVRVEDSDGDVSPTDILTITVNDDGPNAVDDTLATAVAEDGSVQIDVFANDVAGADGVDLLNGITLVGPGPTKGTVTYNGNGTFTYEAAPGAEGPDSFTYQIEDGDGDADTATVSLSIATDSTPTVKVTDGTVDEKGLADGSGELENSAPGTDDSETTTGTFSTTTGGDTLAKLEVEDKDGVWQNVTAGGIVTGLYGTLAVTNTLGVYGWSYTLSDNTIAHSGIDLTGAADQVFDSFRTRATDSDGDITDVDGISAIETITIAINDDGPDAVDDTWVPDITGVTVLTGLLGNDVFGADGADIDNSPASGQVTVTNGTRGTVTYNDDGTFTYTPTGVQVGSDTFTYTITDGDGDTSTATVTVNVQTNTEPTGGGAVSLTLSEAAIDAALDLSPLPADLAAGTTTGTDPANRSETAQASGTLSFTATGEAITVSFASPNGTGWVAPTVTGLLAGYTIDWSINGSNQLVGNLKNGLTDYGPAIYLSLTQTSASAGNTVTPVVTATLSDNLIHSAGIGNVTITGIQVLATDTSNDWVSGTVALTILDDAPNMLAPDAIFLENKTQSVLTEELNFNAGADGVANVVFNVAEGASVTDGAGNSIFLNGEQLFFHIVDSHTVQGRSSVANGSDIGFVATLDPVNGTWTFTTNGTLFNGAAFNTTTFVNPGGGNDAAVVLNSPGSPNDMLVTANGTNSVNTNNIEWGVDTGNSITTGETIRFDMVTNAATNGTVAGSTYTSHYEIGSYTQKVVVGGNASNTATFKIRAINADNDLVFVGDGAGESTAGPITVTVTNAGGALPVVTVNGDGTVTLSNIGDGDTFTIVSNSDPFSAVEITGLAGTNTFNLISPSFTTANAVTPFGIPIAVTGTDGDGDAIAGTVTASLQPDASTWQGTAGIDAQTTTATETSLLGEDGNDTLNGLAAQADLLSGGRGDDYLSGNSGDDILYGGSGADTLLGGAGNDNLTGGSEVDTFVFAEFGAAHFDTITDFVVGPIGDRLDLSAILDVAFGPGSDVSDFVKVTDTGANSVVQVDVTGSRNFTATGDVAVLNNAGSNDTIRIFFEGVEHSVIVDQP